MVPELNEKLSHRISKVNFTDDDINLLKQVVKERPELENILYKVTQLKAKQDANREKSRLWALKNKEERKKRRNKK